MLLKSYRMELFNNECMPSAMTIQCFAHLDQDVSAALPYGPTIFQTQAVPEYQIHSRNMIPSGIGDPLASSVEF